MSRVTILDARRMASNFDCQAIVILAVERGGTVTIVSYGEDKFKCKANW